MARYQPTIDVWTLTPAQRATLQPGQWVRAGMDGPIGRFMGEGRASTVVAWLDNARAWKREPEGMQGYYRRLRDYALSVSRK